MEKATLRAMTVSEVLDRALLIYRAKLFPLLGIVALVFIPLGILKLINVLVFSDMRIVILDVILFIIFQNIAVAALVTAISSANLGKPFTIFSALILGTRKFMSLIGSNLITGFAIALPALLFVLCLSLAQTGYVALILALPTAIFLGTRWSLKSSIIVIENVGAATGLSRSWDLTKDFFGEFLALYLLRRYWRSF